MAPISSRKKTKRLHHLHHFHPYSSRKVANFHPFSSRKLAIFHQNTNVLTLQQVGFQSISQQIPIIPIIPINPINHANSPHIINLTPMIANDMKLAGITVYTSHFHAAAAATQTLHNSSDVFYVCSQLDVSTAASSEHCDEKVNATKVVYDPIPTQGDLRRLAGSKFECKVVAEMASGGFLYPMVNKIIYHEDGTPIMEIDALIRYDHEVRHIDGVFSDEAIIEIKRSLRPEFWNDYLIQVRRRLRYFQKQLIIIFTRPNQPVTQFMAFVKSQLHWRQAQRVFCVTSVHEMQQIIVPR